MPDDKKLFNNINVLTLNDRAFGALARGIALSSADPGRPSAALFWGKSSLALLHAVSSNRRWRDDLAMYLGISPDPAPPRAELQAPNRWIRGEHPLPGEGSFRAGEALIDFFDSLRRFRIPKLQVFLSGGASSLAWLRPQRVTPEKLAQELRGLYEAPLSIRQLNEARSRLCLLKAGGAARWLGRLAPRLRCEVYVVSDVFPFGPEVVGSGPFWDGAIPHRVWLDNRDWIAALKREARDSGAPVLHASAGNLGTWQDWVRSATEIVSEARGAKRDGWIFLGGEPRVRLPRAPGCGGRQTQIATAFLARSFEWIHRGALQILATSSDGVDGNSGAGGALLNAERLEAALLGGGSCRAQRFLQRCEDAVARYDSATFLREFDALVQVSAPVERRFNIQDALVIRVAGKQLA